MEELQQITASNDENYLRQLLNDHGSVSEAVDEYFKRRASIIQRPLIGYAEAVMSFVRSLVQKLPLRRFVEAFLLLDCDRSAMLISSRSYSQMVNECKSDFTYLLVYIHSFASEVSYAEILQSPEIQAVDNLKVFGIKAESEQGHDLVQRLQVTKFPAALLMVNLKGKMQIVARLSNSIRNAQIMVEQIKLIQNQYARQVDQSRAEHQARTQDRLIRDEQELAYERTAQMDRERFRQKRESELIEQAKTSRKRLISESVQEEPAVSSESIKLILRLPDGSKQNRRFMKSWQVSQIQKYSLSLEIPNVSDVRVVTSYPRKVLDNSVQIGEVLKDSEVVIIEEFTSS